MEQTQDIKRVKELSHWLKKLAEYVLIGITIAKAFKLSCQPSFLTAGRANKFMCLRENANVPQNEILL